jgi:hypothetical protein
MIELSAELSAELSVDELALEPIELLPDRDTMQPVIVVGSFAANVATVSQSATSGAVGDVTIVGGSGDVQVASYASNEAQVTQTATSGDVTGVNVVPG